MADRMAPCCEETSTVYEDALEAAAELARAVREFLAGTPYRHGAPAQAERDALALALGAYEVACRG